MSDFDAKEVKVGQEKKKDLFIPPSELFCNVREKAVNDEFTRVYGEIGNKLFHQLITVEIYYLITRVEKD